MSAEAFSYFGNSAIQFALPWLVLANTGGPAAAAIVAAATGVAQIIATIAVGQLIDRFGAKGMAIIATYAARVRLSRWRWRTPSTR